MKSQPTVIVFARAPVPGQCKTRLIPALGAHGAARLHRRLAQRTIRAALEAGARVELWCAPRAGHGFFHSCRRDLGVRLRRQPPGDLGRRMALALNRVAGDADAPVVLAGTDCPKLDAEGFRRAFASLSGRDRCLLQPSHDGGYVLIGTSRRIDPRMLAGIRWSSGRELAQTRRRFERFDRAWSELAPRDDVDTPEDYRRARRAGLI